jgi:hypothetical protein
MDTNEVVVVCLLLKDLLRSAGVPDETSDTLTTSDNKDGTTNPWRRLAESLDDWMALLVKTNQQFQVHYDYGNYHEHETLMSRNKTIEDLLLLQIEESTMLVRDHVKSLQEEWIPKEYQLQLDRCHRLESCFCSNNGDIPSLPTIMYHY